MLLFADYTTAIEVLLGKGFRTNKVDLFTGIIEYTGSFMLRLS
jgi:hypothetical protein